MGKLRSFSCSYAGSTENSRAVDGLDFTVHLGFLELEQGLLLLFPVLDGGGQTWPTEVSDSEGRAEDGGGGALGRSEGGGSREEIR